jgi:membrane protease subunit HflK
MNNIPEATPPPPETPFDAGSQALSEALRSSFAIVKVLMAILVLVFLGSGFFTVRSNERAIILRLGRPVAQGREALLGPGPHWSWPYPIDEVRKVSITGIQKVSSTVGWYATTPVQEAAGTEPPAGGSLNPAVDGYVLTGDNNIVHTRVQSLTYSINDPIRYVFSFVNASNAIQNALDNALLYAAARFRVDDLLTRDVIGFQETVSKRLRELVAQQDLGVTIEQCAPQSIPPRQLKDAFDNVLKAEVKRSQVLSEAHGHENQVLSKASADAESRMNLAESDRARLVKDISSRADEFEQLLPKYRASPRLFVEQRLTEALGRVMTNLDYKISIPESANGKSEELRLQFNRELPKPKQEENKP